MFVLKNLVAELNYKHVCSVFVRFVVDTFIVCAPARVCCVDINKKDSSKERGSSSSICTKVNTLKSTNCFRYNFVGEWKITVMLLLVLFDRKLSSLQLTPRACAHTRKTEFPVFCRVIISSVYFYK